MTGPDTRRLRLFIFVLFFISGACGLIYEVIWTRMMMLTFGVTVYAVSAVLCSFMAGLALGSLYFGRLADRSRRLLSIYGALEIGIAAFALLLPRILEVVDPLCVWIHRRFFNEYDLFCVLRFLVIFPILLAPTFLMGGTFPVISRYFIRRRDSFGRDVGLLYAVNTSGAVVGTFVVGFVLLAFYGIRASTLFAAALNSLVGVTAMLLGRRVVADELANAPSGAPAEDPRRAIGGQCLAEALPPAIVPLTLFAIGASGFSSFGLQVLWTRVLTYHTHNSTYAFSGILMVFLIGLALGSWLFSLLAPRIRRPVLLFAGLEIAIGVWAVASMYLVGELPRLSNKLSRIIPWNDFSEAVLLILAKVWVIVGPPTILMGMTFPLATSLVTRRLEETGYKVGLVYSVNTLGTVLGSFVVGFMLIPELGIRTSIIFIAAVNLFVAVALLWPSRRVGNPLCWGVALASGLAIAASLAWVPRDIFARVFTKTIGRVVFYHEGVTDTISAVDFYDNPRDVEHRRPMKETRMLLFGDGRGTAGNPTRGLNRYYGHIGMFLQEDPKDVLVICIGVANTISGLIKHEGVRSLDAVDISRGVVEASAYFESNAGVLQEPRDPRIRVYVEDGRNFLKAVEKQYDLIEVEPPELHTAGVVFLYTREFYEACRRRLKPGGILVNWASTYVLTEAEFRPLAATFASVFPQGTLWTDPILWNVLFVGGDRPLRIPLKNFYDRLERQTGLRRQMAQDRMDDPMLFLSHFIMDAEHLRRYGKGAPLITDDKTIIDFTSPRQPYSGFGFVQWMSPNDWLSFFTNPRTSLTGMEPGAPWKMLQRLNQQCDSAAAWIDWSGFAPDQRARLQARLERFIQGRRKLAEAFPPGAGIWTFAKLRSDAAEP